MQTKEQAIKTILLLFNEQIIPLMKRCEEKGRFAMIFSPTGQLDHLMSLKLEVYKKIRHAVGVPQILRELSTFNIEESLLQDIVSEVTQDGRFGLLHFWGDMDTSFTLQLRDALAAVEMVGVDDRRFVHALHKEMSGHSIASLKTLKRRLEMGGAPKITGLSI